MLALGAILKLQDAQADVFVSYGNSKQVAEYDQATGEFIGSVTAFNPHGLAFAPNGNLVTVSYGDGSISQYYPSGDFAGYLTPAIPSSNGVCFDDHGRMYVCIHEQGRVVRYDANGNFEGTFASGINKPVAIAMGHDHKMYVSGLLDGNIWRFRQDGTSEGPIIRGLTWPTGLAIDSHGLLFVSLYLSGTVNVFSTSGNQIGPYIFGIPNPHGLCFDSQGQLYVASAGANAAYCFGIGGTLLHTYTGLGQRGASNRALYVGVGNAHFSKEAKIRWGWTAAGYDFVGAIYNPYVDVWVENDGGTAAPDVVVSARLDQWPLLISVYPFGYADIGILNPGVRRSLHLSFLPYLVGPGGPHTSILDLQGRTGGPISGNVFGGAVRIRFPN